MMDETNSQANLEGVDDVMIDGQDVEDEVVETEGPKKKGKAKRQRRLESDVWKSFGMLPLA